ncbi:MAG: DUF4157 domain-containing protein [Myxococcales bacterium]|nr:DUF4157 domain-containing protein [Myxococcales bacterium]
MNDHELHARATPSHDASPAGPAPGKVTRVASRHPIQRRATGSAGAAAAPAPASSPAPLADPFALHAPDDGAPVQLRAATVAGADEPATPTGGAATTPLPDGVRGQMERALGADFADVRVREDASAGALGADAYARGDEITFAPGQFDPASRGGQELIGHELVHVVQQRQGRVATTQARGGTAINADPALEREADELGARAARGERVALGGGTAGGATVGDAAQLREGKVKARGVRVRIDQEEVVLPPGTRVDVEGARVRILSGRHGGAEGVLLAEGGEPFEFDPEPRASDDHVVFGDCSTGFIGQPRAIAVDGAFLVVQTTLQTRNLYDRVKWTIGFQHPDSPEGRGAGVATGVTPDLIDDRNPAWTTGGTPIGNPEYQFRGDFAGFPGNGAPAAVRIAVMRIPLARIRAYYEAQLHRWTDTDICIQLGIDMYYGGPGPAVATEAERALAFERTDPRGHQYGFGATSSPQSLGRVVFDGAVLAHLQIAAGARQAPDAYHQQPLPENPPNSLELPFPTSYPADHPSFEPLAPPRFLERDGQDQPRLGIDDKRDEMQLKLQTRIENEATLKVSSLGGLYAIVDLLSAWGEGDVTELMGAGDPLLGGFTWKLEKKKPVVFTDVYLDDAALHGLRAGLGIRKRRSKEAAKLNVKTGAGYNVKAPAGTPRHGEAYREAPDGEGTDIWRRHEIGFSLNPDATPAEIGAFLAEGADGHDPWNLGAQQANLGLDAEQQVDFGGLREAMVLIGDRTKFNLKAIPPGGKGVINIEISCDHTIGCRPADWDIDPTRDDFDFGAWYRTTNAKAFPETFNVEMELEHLGAGGAQAQSDGPSSSESRGSMWGLPSQIRRGNQEARQPQLGAPVGFPDRRPYTKPDAANPAFGTPSFSVFYAAHNRIIAQLRAQLDRVLTPGDLGPDVQKLEAIRDKLGLLGEPSEAPSLEPRQLPPRGGPPRGGPGGPGGSGDRGSGHGVDTSRPMPSSSSGMHDQAPRGDEFDGMLGSSSDGARGPGGPSAPTRMSLFEFNKRYRKGKGDGAGLNCLLDSLCQVAPEAQAKFGGATREETVGKMREALVAAGYTKFKRTLDIASAQEGQAILAELDIDLVVFIEAQGEIQALPIGRSGGVTRYLHFKDAHYSPVFAK